MRVVRDYLLNSTNDIVSRCFRILCVSLVALQTSLRSYSQQTETTIDINIRKGEQLMHFPQLFLGSNTYLYCNLYYNREKQLQQSLSDIKKNMMLFYISDIYMYNKK